MTISTGDVVTPASGGMMGKLADLVQRDYQEERDIVRATGSLWKNALLVFFILVMFWGIDLLFHQPWSKSKLFLALIFLVTVPHIWRALDRYKVAQEMRHHREVRVEMKINALLGIVSIRDDDEKGREPVLVASCTTKGDSEDHE